MTTVELKAVSDHAVASARLRRKWTLVFLYARQVSSGLIIYQPIFIPFLISRGLNMLDVAFLQTAYNLGVLMLDIPTGYFADRFGRKWALAAANSGLVVGTALIAMGHSLSVFMLAELCYAFAIAMDSGVHSAYLFEWLREQGREHEYYRFDALGTFLFLVIGAMGTLVAGYFAEKSLLTPVLLTIGLTSIGIPAAIALPQKRSREAESKTPSASAHAHAKPHPHGAHDLAEGMRGIGRITLEILRVPGLRWALGVSIIWLWSRQYINLIISQPYFLSIGLNYRHFGMLYSILTLTSGVIALLSHRLIQRPDLRLTAAAGILAIPTCLGIMGFTHSRLGLVGFFLFAVPYGLCTAITNTLLNRQFSDHDNRATFLSIVDFFVRGAASLLVLGLGWILARHGASAALMAASAISGAVALSLMPGVLRFAKGHVPTPVQKV